MCPKLNDLSIIFVRGLDDELSYLSSVSIIITVYIYKIKLIMSLKYLTIEQLGGHFDQQLSICGTWTIGGLWKYSSGLQEKIIIYYFINIQNKNIWLKKLKIS